jgi:protease-4
MKQFFTNIAANLATIALLFLVVLMLTIGLIAAASGDSAPSVPNGAVLVVDLSQSLADRPAERSPGSAWDRALADPGASKLSLRGAVVALQEAASDDRISSVLLRGNVASDGLSSGYGGLIEFREALAGVVAAGKPVHAYLVDPTVRDYYIASAASTITLDPFGTVQFNGLSATQVHFAGFLEKYGIGVQVSRVGKFKAAVEPFTRPNMSPENRAQTRRYLEATWSEIKRSVAQSRVLDTAQLQQLADSVALFTPDEALRYGLIDRVAHFDVLLGDLRRASGATVASSETVSGGDSTASIVDSAVPLPMAADSAADLAAEDTGNVDTSTPGSLLPSLPATLPQILLRDYAQIAVARTSDVTARRKVAIVYAQGEIVNGEGGTDQVGGTSFARELRKLRNDNSVRAIVLRVNSPGGSVTASEEIQRELVLLNAKKPVVVSMGTLAASGGYWIATAARRVFAQPTTLTGSIGVFAIFPNLKGIAEKNGITTDTVSTARYADIYSIARPRTNAELALVQRSIDAVYDAFLLRVANARSLPLDSVAAIAEGRVWSGEDALALGLVDEMGDLNDAIVHAAAQAQLGDDYGLLEVPKVKGTTEMLQELFDDTPPPVVGTVRQALGGSSAPVQTSAAIDAWTRSASRHGPLADAVRSLARELGGLLMLNDPRGTYARMPFVIQLP